MLTPRKGKWPFSRCLLYFWWALVSNKCIFKACKSTLFIPSKLKFVE